MAGNAGAIRAGKAFVEMALNSGPLTQGLAATLTRLKAWGGAVESMGTKLFALGAAAVGGFLGASKIFSDMGSALIDTAARTGFAVEELSALQFAAGQAGASFEDLETAIKFMQKTGAGTTAEDFLKIADAIQAIEDPAERTRKAIEVFGKGGTAMLGPIMDGMRKTATEAQRLGLVMSTADAEAADKLGDAFGGLVSSLKMAVAMIGSALAPMLMELMDQVKPIIAATVQWFKENKGLAVSLFQVSLAAVGVGAGLMAIGKVIPLVLSGASLIGKVFTTTFMLVPALIKLVVGAFALLLSPIGVVVVAVAGLTAAWLLFTEEGGRTVTALAEAWNQISSIATTAWKGIVDAVMSGDLALAGQIALAGLKAAWTAGLAALQTGWVELTTSLQQSWTGAMAVLADAWANFILGAKLLWGELKGDFLKGIEVIKFKLGMITKEQGRANVAGIDQKTKEGREGAIAERDAKNKAIGDDFRREQAAIEARRKERLAGVGDELKAAREELDALVGEAARKRAEQAAGVAKGMDETKKKIGLGGGTGTGVGTFSAAGALAMGGGGGVGAKLEKQLKEQEQIRKGIEKLVEHARAGAPLAFA